MLTSEMVKEAMGKIGWGQRKIDKIHAYEARRGVRDPETLSPRAREMLDSGKLNWLGSIMYRRIKAKNYRERGL